jgi:hypothetical protein
MKKTPCLFLGLLALGFLSQGRTADAQTIKSSYAKEFDFGTLKRLGIRNVADNKLLDQKIMRVVSWELAAREYIKPRLLSLLKFVKLFL